MARFVRASDNSPVRPSVGLFVFSSGLPKGRLTRCYWPIFHTCITVFTNLYVQHWSFTYAIALPLVEIRIEVYKIFDSGIVFSLELQSSARCDGFWGHLFIEVRENSLSFNSKKKTSG